ncbi:MAG: PfkB family carbohydrate kinase [Treponema sp.]|nr:PfkB family carbohydrate kinase [Treponema sp.]
MKLLIYGALNIDLIYPVDHIVIPGETIKAAALEKSAGGKGANQAAAAANAGAEVFLAGRIGNDGGFLLSLLKPFGVNTEYVAAGKGSTGQALIQLDKNGQNAIVYYAGENGQITAEETETVIADFGKGDIISLQNELTQIPEMMKAAAKRGMVICCNPSPWDEKIRGYPLELVDIFIVNEIEGPALAELPQQTPAAKVLDALTKRFPGKEIILTAGSEGAYYGRDQAREKGNAVKVEVVDTTGAGDTFTGYYLAARLGNYSVPDALNIACKAASIAVSRKGALAAIPGKAEVF